MFNKATAITDRSGFSLSEIVVVLAIVAIMGAISVPMISSTMRSMQLIGDLRSIAAGIGYAKLSATARLTQSQVVFNLAENSWCVQIRDRDTGNFVTDGAVNILSGGMADSGIAFSSNSTSGPSGFPTTSSTSVVFNTRGIPTSAPNSVVYLSDGHTNYAITVSLAGKAQIWKQTGEAWVSQ